MSNIRETDISKRLHVILTSCSLWCSEAHLLLEMHQSSNKYNFVNNIRIPLIMLIKNFVHFHKQIHIQFEFWDLILVFLFLCLCVDAKWKLVEMADRTQKSVCRLCYYETFDTVDIFGEKGIAFDYEGKITKYLYLTVSRTDRFVKSVCWMCTQNLETFHRFYEKVK